MILTSLPSSILQDISSHPPERSPDVSQSADKVKDKKVLGLKAGAYFNKSFVHDEYDENHNVKVRIRSRDYVHEAGEDDDSDTVSKLQSCLWITIVISTLILPILMLVIGSVTSCPAMPSIPVFLLLLASFIATGNLLNLVLSTRYVRNLFATRPDVLQLLTSAANVVINLLVAFVFLCMTVWVHVNGRPSLTDGSCSPVLFLFSFCFVNFFLCFFASILIISFSCYIIFTAFQILQSDNSKD